MRFRLVSKSVLREQGPGKFRKKLTHEVQTPILVEFGNGGTVRAEPSTAVVAVIDPRTAPQALTFTDADQIDADTVVHLI